MPLTRPIRPQGPPLDSAGLEKLRRIAPGILAGHHAARINEWQAQTLPEEVAFKLTNRCDLRCGHCYQWNEAGYHHQLEPSVANSDLDLGIVAKVLAATRPSRSNIYLWGGEPLLYRDWDGLVDLLIEDPRWISICTNGTMIARRLDSLLKLSDRLEVSISLDGFPAEHNSVRGKGAFDRVLRGLRLLAEQKLIGCFRGEITVNCLITDQMVGRIPEFVDWLESENVDTVYISFPWFLSSQAMSRMDDYYRRHFGLAQVFERPSWHSYNYSLSAARIPALANSMALLGQRSGKIKVRCNPELQASELDDFIRGNDVPAQNKTRCQSIGTRMDVFPDGQVISCKFFPEFRMGSLVEHDVVSIWHGEKFNALREKISRNGLMPVCAKCNLLYTRGG